MKQVYRSNKKTMCLALRPWSAGHWQSSGYVAWTPRRFSARSHEKRLRVQATGYMPVHVYWVHVYWLHVYVNYIGGSRSFDKF